MMKPKSDNQKVKVENGKLPWPRIHPTAFANSKVAFIIDWTIAICSEQCVAVFAIRLIRFWQTSQQNRRFAKRADPIAIGLQFSSLRQPLAFLISEG